MLLELVSRELAKKASCEILLFIHNILECYLAS